jgi:peptidoglycan L-alanyl-D-glutamate endopeptidase CwlK
MEKIKMNNFTISATSLNRLDGVEQKGIDLFKRALELSPVDFGVAWMGGKRSDEEQNELFNSKVSTKDGYIKISKHQIGKAFDFLPYVNGKPRLNDKHLYYMIHTAILIAAKELNMKVTLGSDWDRDGEYITDQTFNDLPHVQWD